MAAPDPAVLPKHQYTVSIEFEAPIDVCFHAGYLEEAMMAWVPSPKSVVYDHSKAPYRYGPGSSRLVTLKSGTALTEIVFISTAPTLLAYYIPRFGFGVDALLKNYQGRMHYEALGPNRTRLTWKGYFDCPGVGVIFEPLFRFAMRKLISTMAHNMRPYLAAQGAALTARG